VVHSYNIVFDQPKGIVMKSTAKVLPQVQLGRNGPFVGMQGLGCMGMSEFYGATNEPEARLALARALELGVTMFDTADMYATGANETFLAPFVRANRKQVFIATKFGYSRTAENPNDWSINNRPEYIRSSVDRSLKRLDIETIDLYYMHRRDPTIPLADSVGAMAELVAAGKVRWLGLSEVSADELREACAIHPICALQSEWSLFSRKLERDVIAVAAELGTAIVPYAPLGRGLLTGAAFSNTLSEDDARRNFPRFSFEHRDTNQRLILKIEELAANRGVTSAQVALAWIYTQAKQLKVTAVPIPGTRKQSRVEQNVLSISLVLSQNDMEILDRLAAAVQGVAV